MQFAYLDAGSGSLIASALVGGAAAAGVAVRSARSRLGGVLSRKRRAPESTESEQPDVEADAPAVQAEAADAPATASAASEDDGDGAAVASDA